MQGQSRKEKTRRQNTEQTPQQLNKVSDKTILHWQRDLVVAATEVVVVVVTAGTAQLNFRGLYYQVDELIVRTGGKATGISCMCSVSLFLPLSPWRTPSYFACSRFPINVEVSRNWINRTPSQKILGEK